ncbi:TPA: hypothetical protein NPN74_004815 [Klebsiella quasipneumoniae subsp. quasipneumoniae]|nr:hypothetical protein [Klebsiella quasipneumoniae subsp. quasipneumoniae]
MKIKYLVVLAAISASVLVGCTSEDQRLAKCEAKGISRDVCYQEEKAYWRNYQSNMATLNASNQQADAIREGNEIQKKHYKHVDQKAQTAKKAGVKHWDGMELKMTQNGLVVDGKPASASETTKEATTYQQGLYTFIVYKNGKIAVMDDKGALKGYAK